MRTKVKIPRPPPSMEAVLLYIIAEFSRLGAEVKLTFKKANEEKELQKRVWFDFPDQNWRTRFVEFINSINDTGPYQIDYTVSRLERFRLIIPSWQVWDLLEVLREAYPADL